MPSLNKAKTPPFTIENETDVSEEVRLKYRYLDLRRPDMLKRLKCVINYENNSSIFRSEMIFRSRNTYLTKSTPEGARDYLVPSRVHQGEFYALPQSPQIFKQLLMIGGVERYYQIARCFRDEDFRADRQPEFTQIDIEMSFMNQEEIMDLSERLIKYVVKQVKGIELTEPFPRITYDEAMERFGSDKPDTRFGLELRDVSDIVIDSSFKVFANTVQGGGVQGHQCKR